MQVAILAALCLVVLSVLVIVLLRNRVVGLEKELRRSNSQRLEELNQLMVGLAHEVRNPLNSIRLNLYTADRVFRGEAQLDAEEITAMLGESVREIERVDSLMNLLLGYARADDLEMTTVHLCREIRSVADFLQPSLQAGGIALELALPDEEGCQIRAGRGHVRQVILNLLSNAKEAVPETGGKISIGLKRHRGAFDVTVTDNGGGIPSEHQNRLFAPFFSTKEQGPGLGLAIVRSLMERTGGHVKCLRTDRGNCQFRVSWPAHRNEPAERLAP